MPRPTFWHIPYERNPFFTGREEVLTQLHTALQADARVALSHPLGISGLGGIGKTQTALEYAYRYQSDYKAIFWVRADSATSLISSLTEVARILELPERDEQDQEIVIQAVLHWLRDNTGWLLIYDNIDDLSITEPFLPKDGTGHLLFTTRAHGVGGLAQRLDIGKMEPEMGALLLLHRAGLLALPDPLQMASSEDQRVACVLAQELDGLPLALDQAGAYIHETSSPLADYVALYQTHHQEILQRRGTLALDYPASVATTWSLSFERVRQANRPASELLSFCAFLAPDAIPEAILEEAIAIFQNPWVNSTLREIAKNPLAFDRSMETLLRYSLITRQADESLFSIHRLAQTVIRDAATRVENVNTVSMTVIPALRETFPNPEDIQQWKRCAQYVPHVLACIPWIREHELFFESIGELLLKAGNFLQKQGRYSEAEQAYTLCLQLFRDVGEAIWVATTLHMLGMMYQMQRHYQQAEDAYQQAQTLLEAQSEDVTFILAAIQNNRADMYRDQGNFKQAADSYDHHLLKQREILGEADQESATTLNNRALLFVNQAKYEDAEALHLQALAIRQNVLGRDHPEVANSLDNLGTLYRLMGRYTEAEQNYLQALTMREQHYGEEHPFIALTLNNLGELYRMQDKYDLAEDYLIRAMTIREKHPESAFRSQSLTSLGSIYTAQGRYPKGEIVLRQALELQERDLGREHIEIATTLNNLGACCIHQDKLSEAEEYFTRALVMKEKLLGKNHPELVWTLNNLASLYQRKKDYREAERFYLQAIEIQEQFYGPQDPGLAKILTNAGEFYRVQKKYKKAQETFSRALNIYMKPDEPVHLDMAKVLNNLGLLADEKRSYTAAEQFYQGAIAINERFLGTDHPELVFPLYNLADLYEHHGKRTEAEALYQRALAICEDLDSEHPLTEIVRDRYAAFLAGDSSGSKKSHSWFKKPRFKL